MLECFSLYDEKAKCYLNPFFCKSAVEAIRGLVQACDDPKTNLHRFPDDFSLYRLCRLDDGNGSIVDANPELVVRVNQLAEKKGDL